MQSVSIIHISRPSHRSHPAHHYLVQRFALRVQLYKEHITLQAGSAYLTSSTSVLEAARVELRTSWACPFLYLQIVIEASSNRSDTTDTESALSHSLRVLTSQRFAIDFLDGTVQGSMSCHSTICTSQQLHTSLPDPSTCPIAMSPCPTGASADPRLVQEIRHVDRKSTSSAQRGCSVQFSSVHFSLTTYPVSLIWDMPTRSHPRVYPRKH